MPAGWQQGSPAAAWAPNLCTATVQCCSQRSCWLHTGSALQRSQTPTSQMLLQSRNSFSPLKSSPEQRSSQPTEQQVQKVDWDQGLIKSDHDASFMAFCWCREAENSSRRYQPRDESSLLALEYTGCERWELRSHEPSSRHLLARDERSYLDTCVCLPSSKPVSAT